MPIKYIHRRERYKYELVDDYTVHIPELNDAPEVTTRFATLTHPGTLHIKANFMWDGSSGPTVDSDKDKIPSLVHDVTCEFVRMGLLPESWVPTLNRIYYRLCRDRGMLWIQARWRLLALQLTKGSTWGKKQNPPRVREAA